jgi:formate C-acetyltransferase
VANKEEKQMENNYWNGFAYGAWQNEINVRDFIQTNYKEYKGDASFLAKATPRTESLMKTGHYAVP